jgi:hypothetical protein
MVAFNDTYTKDDLLLPALGCTLTELHLLEVLSPEEREKRMNNIGANLANLRVYFTSNLGERRRILMRELGGV